MLNFPSECRQIADLVEREKVYRESVKAGQWQDSLDTRINAKVGLSESEARSLYELVSSHCRQNTKLALRQSIACIPNIRSYGIYSRVLFENDCASYCAGQSYTDEIRIVRGCLL